MNTMDITPSLPGFETGPSPNEGPPRFLRKLAYCIAGPTDRSGDQGAHVENSIHRHGLKNEQYDPVYPYMMVRCSPVQRWPDLYPPNPEIVIKVHFRILSPQALHFISRPTPFVVVAVAATPTAILPWPVHPQPHYNHAVAASADVEVPFHTQDDFDAFSHRVYERIGFVSGLTGEFLSREERNRWLVALFAENSLLSERMDENNWEGVKKLLDGGSWWVRQVILSYALCCFTH